jgi:hypothetical protein
MAMAALPFRSRSSGSSARRPAGEARPACPVDHGFVNDHEIGARRRAWQPPCFAMTNRPVDLPPDLNPIEQLFAEIEALLRKAAARTKDSSGRPSAAGSKVKTP